MMIYRVNLIREDETRYQGAVSRSFMVRTVIFTVGIVIALTLILAALRYRGIQQRLDFARARWEQIEPVFNNAREMLQELNANRKILGELQIWNDQRFVWFDPLYQLQQVVPDSVQLTRLNISGATDLKDAGQAARKGAPPSAAAAPSGKADRKPPEAQVLRRFTMGVEGKATGMLSDEIVVQFVRGLAEADQFKPMLESVKLQSLRRENTRDEADPNRIFVIEAQSVTREWK